MAKAKTIADLLAEQPAQDLARMREANLRSLERARAEVARLELQAQLIETALTKRGKPGRPGSLTAEVVLEAATETEPPMTAADVQATLTGRGLAVSVNAVRNHLNRLVESGELERDDKKRYIVAAPVFIPSEFIPAPPAASAADFPSAAPDDDIPF